MKLLGEKSLNKTNDVIRLLTINSCNKHTIRDLTDAECEVYHIDCCFLNGYFHLCHKNWISSRRIHDALSQINQHCGNIKPYVQITCISENPVIIKTFIETKAKWGRSFRRLVIL